MTLSPTRPKPQLVITGFQPFGDHDYNPSWDVARSMAEVCDARARLLPVTFTTAAQFARAHLTAARPSPLFFVHLGLAADRQEICFERRAKNVRDNKPDNMERTLPVRLPKTRELVTGDRDERITLMDLDSLIANFNESISGGSLPTARVSEDCGKYVCNALLYHSLRSCEEARANGHGAQAIFIHVPPLSTEDAQEAGRHLAEALLKQRSAIINSPLFV